MACKRASVVENVDGVFCAAGDSASVVIVEISVREADLILAYFGEGWKESGWGAHLCRLVRGGGTGRAYAGREKTLRGGDAMSAPLLMALNAENGSGRGEPVRKRQ